MKRTKHPEGNGKIWEENILKFEPGDKFEGDFNLGTYEITVNSRTYGGMYRGCHISFTAIFRPKYGNPYTIKKHAELWAHKTLYNNEYRESFMVTPELCIYK